MTLNICTFKWGSKYSVEHVARLWRMLRRNLTIPWRATLITDSPQADAQELLGRPDLGSITWEVLDLGASTWDKMRHAKLCGIRLSAFQPGIGELLGQRFCWVDMDVVITGNVDHIFGRTEPFVGLRTPKGPLYYNGSFVMMDAGRHPEVYAAWGPRLYSLLSAHYAQMGMQHGGQSDEGWMSFMLPPNLPTVGVEDGIHYMKHIDGLPQGARMVILNGRRFDPADPRLQKRHRWVKEHWR